MKQLLAIMFVILSMSAAYAGGFMLLHVGSPDGNGGGGGGGCTGTIDLSTGCVQPMLR